MKPLQNKLTREIGCLVCSFGKTPEKITVVECIDGKRGSKVWYYNSLAELNADWEDYEEPFSTSFYTIVDGEVKHCIFYRERVAGCPSDAWAYLEDDGRERIKQLKEIGLYFETKEEAEKAVEKLKAWKRLKDKGFRFDGYGRYHWTGEEFPHVSFLYPNFNDLFDDKQVVNDLDLLFCMEVKNEQ